MYRNCRPSLGVERSSVTLYKNCIHPSLCTGTAGQVWVLNVHPSLCTGTAGQVWVLNVHPSLCTGTAGQVWVLNVHPSLCTGTAGRVWVLNVRPSPCTGTAGQVWVLNVHPSLCTGTVYIRHFVQELYTSVTLYRNCRPGLGVERSSAHTEFLPGALSVRGQPPSHRHSSSDRRYWI